MILQHHMKQTRRPGRTNLIMLKNKLRSRRGASITFALLLFLVCAAIGSAVLVAGTAASGRMADTAKMDQRYYAVTSAAELMKDLIDEKTVTIVEVTTSSKTTTYTNGTAGDPVLNEGNTFSTYLFPDKTGSEVTYADCNTVETNGYTGPNKKIDGTGYNITPSLASITEDAAYKKYKIVTLTGTDSRFTLTSSEGLKTSLGVADGETDPLAVKINEKLDANGNITLTLYNEKNGDSKFTQKMVFTATVSTGISTATSDGAPSTPTSSGGSTTYTITTTITEMETTTITWTLTSVETISEPVTASASGS